ncbi:hypothetical protein SAMN05444409_1820 [Epilithonimonas zeae]|uniref:Uncharacterized protein n=1 Tax=Epilithonimonas zeae TaxID=1416779 RepID=A0A1N6GFF8_9FLAO|nr:hypothetical protein SAMN05444409_1820 [Epilithonimonas zeae]
MFIRQSANTLESGINILDKYSLKPLNHLRGFNFISLDINIQKKTAITDSLKNRKLGFILLENTLFY